MGTRFDNDNFRSRADLFKQCTKCHHCWESREVFLGDPNLKIIGYQANFVNLEMGAFLFNHSCGTTMSILAEDFVDLYHGPFYEGRETGGDKCPGYCLKTEELHPCSAHCECSYVREIVSIIQSWPKNSSSSL